MPAPVFRNALPAQTMLQEYRVEQVLGAGGFGITYRAHDTHLEKDVALKEYLPGSLAMRAPDGRVLAQATEHEAGYKWGLDRFLLEARTLAKFSHPHIVRVLRYFEANATAYMVMEYEKGDPLKTVLQLDPQPPEAKLKALLAPILDGLEAVHATGFLHRDVKPDNIFVRADGRPVLIDFGAARQALGGETRSLTSILTPGYAPLEQYSGEGKQGPWTDLYAMGGVLYRAVTDKNPPDAVSRIRGDSIGPGLAAARGKYGEPFLNAIEWALKLDEKQRPQSVAQWKSALLAERRVSATLPPRPPELERRRSRPVPPEEKSSRWPAIALAAIIAVSALGYWNKQRAARIEAQRAAGEREAAERVRRDRYVPRYAAPLPARAPEREAQPPAEAPAAPSSAAASAPAAAEAAREPAAPDPPMEDKIQRVREAMVRDFKWADANKDGYLTQDEVRGKYPSVERDFARWDRNGDGQISLQEYFQTKREMFERKAWK